MKLLKKYIHSFLTYIFKALNLKKMNELRNQKFFEEVIETTLADFKKFCEKGSQIFKNGTIKEYIKNINIGKTLEFVFLSHEYCIEYDIKAFEKIAYLRTYRLQIDRDNYPNLKKMKHISDLDIVFFTDGQKRFVKDLTTEINLGSNGNSAKIDASNITDFNLKYMNQLFETCKNESSTMQ